MAVVALDIITSALLKCNAIGVGDTLSASEANDGLLRLNAFVDTLNARRQNIYSVPAQTFAWGIGVPSYSIGPTAPAPFNVPRPILIQSATAVVGGVHFALDLPDGPEWSGIPDRGTATSPKPTKLFCDYNFPNALLSIHALPQQFMTLEIFAWLALQPFATLQSPVSLPPGYQLALEWGLADQCKVEWGAPASVWGEVHGQAMAAIGNMQSLNAEFWRAMDATGKPPAGLGIPQPQPVIPAAAQQQ